MRRATAILTPVLALVLLAPVAASARERHERHHHARHHVVHHARVRHERLGSTAATASSAGTVASFTGGTLTVRLADGSTVSGRVTTATRIECAAAENRFDARDRDGGDDRGDRGDGGGDRGDRGDQNENNAEHAPACSSSSLTPGAMVHEAELDLSSAGNVWRDIELAS